MKLLEECKYLAPSADYLYARLGPRRRRVRSEARTGGDPRRRLRREYRWLYRRLASQLLGALLPLFEYGELQVLVLSLRYLSAGEAQRLAELLEQSLLASELKRMLLATREPAVVVVALERRLAPAYPVFYGAGETWLRHGPGGLEQQLLGGYLNWAVRRSRTRPVRDLLARLLDLRNLLALYKHLQWQLPLPPKLFEGGTIPLTECQRLWQRRELPALLQRVRRYAAPAGAGAQLEVEDLLERGIGEHLRRRGWEPLQIGVILDFLWTCRTFGRELAAAGMRQTTGSEG